MKVRRAHVGDERALTELNAHVHDPHVEGRPDYFQRAGSGEKATWFSSTLRQPAARIWIAEQGRGPVGYVLALMHERPANPFCRARRWCEIDQVAVAPGHRGRGVARAMIRQVVDDAGSEGIRDIEVGVWSFNREANRVFESLGFRPRLVRYELDRGDRG